MDIYFNGSKVYLNATLITIFLHSMEKEFKRYLCVICGFIYDEAEGWPEDGIEPGTKWEDVPDDWFCPDCGATKDEFEMVEMGS